MRTVVLGVPPLELAAWMERRRQLGLDHYDEVWSGDCHIPPMVHSSHGEVQAQLIALLAAAAAGTGLLPTGPWNLGGPDDFRVPDLGLHRASPDTAWVKTAALVGEVESPDDETWDKLGFYAAHGVDEVLIVSPTERSVAWLTLRDGAYERTDASGLVGLTVEELISQLDWPGAS